MGYLAGSTSESGGILLWCDARLDALASYSGILSRILGGIHWRATLAGYSAGSTGRDPLASRSGGILGGIHWRAALVGYGGIHWRAALA